MKCRDCKFWGRNGESVFRKPADDYRICLNEDLGAVGTGYGEEADVATSPEFGCVQFEARE
jgi:hypothetical protein